MKTTTLMIIGTLIGASAFATAQDKPKRDGRGPGGGGGFPPEVIEKFDTDKDGDGKLSDEEKAAIPKPPKGDGPDGDKPEKPEDKKPEGQ